MARKVKPAKPRVRYTYWVFNKEDGNDGEGPYTRMSDAKARADELNNYFVGRRKVG